MLKIFPKLQYIINNDDRARHRAASVSSPDTAASYIHMYIYVHFKAGLRVTCCYCWRLTTETKVKEVLL